MSGKVWRSPAKVNLFLSVGPPDTTGYHPIRTVFQAVGLYDEMEIEWRGLGEPDEITFEDAAIPEENTLTKTLRLLRELLPVPGARVQVKKVIPQESGLGGGSSNAATLLRAVRQRLQDTCEPRFMHEVARAVGADVPFFLVGGCARGEGYGEQLTPLEEWSHPYWVVVVKPSEGQSTAEAYRLLDARERPWLPFPPLDAQAFKSWMHNDFAGIASCESTDWEERLLIHGAEAAMLSGSGSAIFGVFASEEQARRAEVNLQNERASWVAAAPFLSRKETLWTP